MSAHLERSQALVEFAVVAPVLLLLTFGILDFGRALFYYTTLQEAAREGARTAVASSAPLPSDSDVLGAVISRSFGIALAAPCANGPIPATNPPTNVAWVYVTQPNPPATQQSAPPPDAPGGETGTAAGGCSAIVPAQGQVLLQVTVVYSFSPATPLINNLIGNRLLLTGTALARTEY